MSILAGAIASQLLAGTRVLRTDDDHESSKLIATHFGGVVTALRLVGF